MHSARTLVSSILSAASLLQVSGAAHATLYDLSGFTMRYLGATSYDAFIETSAYGQYSDESSIESLLNSSVYGVSLYQGDTQLASLDQSNASWDLSFMYEPAGRTASALLSVTPEALTLQFFTPNETTEGRLLVRRSSDAGLPFYMHVMQSNNVSDYNFAVVDHNAINFGYEQLAYGEAFVFPAVAVPAPGALGLMVSGLIGLAIAGRRRVDRGVLGSKRRPAAL